MSHTRTPGRDRSSRSRLLPARIIPTYEHTVLSAALAQSEKTNCTPSLAKQQFGNRLIIRSHKQQCTPRVGSRSSHVRSEQVRTFLEWTVRGHGNKQSVHGPSMHSMDSVDCHRLLWATVGHNGPQWATTRRTCEQVRTLPVPLEHVLCQCCSQPVQASNADRKQTSTQGDACLFPPIAIAAIASLQRKEGLASPAKQEAKLG